jgi:hypothetical protein
MSIALRTYRRPRSRLRRVQEAIQEVQQVRRFWYLFYGKTKSPFIISFDFGLE